MLGSKSLTFLNSLIWMAALEQLYSSIFFCSFLRKMPDSKPVRKSLSRIPCGGSSFLGFNFVPARASCKNDTMTKRANYFMFKHFINVNMFIVCLLFLGFQYPPFVDYMYSVNPFMPIRYLWYQIYFSCYFTLCPIMLEFSFSKYWCLSTSNFDTVAPVTVIFWL